MPARRADAGLRCSVWMFCPRPSPPPRAGSEQRPPSTLAGGAGGGVARRFGLLAALSGLALTACTTGALQPATPISVDAGRTAGLVSAYRVRNGLGPVGVDSRLMDAARAQALAMGKRDKIGHRVAGPLPRRIANAGYEWGAAAENLGAGYASLDATMAGWRNSSGHRANLLNPNVTEIGVAAVATPPGSKHRTYWALILAAPRPERAAAAGPLWSGPYGMGLIQ